MFFVIAFKLLNSTGEIFGFSSGEMLNIILGCVYHVLSQGGGLSNIWKKKKKL